jgi:hypothetical protein
MPRKRAAGWDWFVAALVAFALLSIAIFAGSGCASDPPNVGALVRGANDVLGELCKTREALTAAKEHLDRGDVGGAIDLLKAYLNEHGADPEVAAVLQLLESQVDRLRFTEPPTDWGF